MSHSLEKIAFHSLGCKLNFSETSTMVRYFVQRGYSIVKGFENADIHVINTCSVTDKADKKAKKIIVIDQGKLVESGTYEDLIAKDGLFSSLNKSQIIKE